MTAPRLTCRLVLETAAKIADGSGGFSETWTPLGTLWAELQAGSGRDTGVAGGPVALTAWRIVVRGAAHGAPDRPAPGQRFRMGARLFPIRAVAERDAAGRYLTCFCEEEIAQ